MTIYPLRSAINKINRYQWCTKDVHSGSAIARACASRNSSMQIAIKCPQIYKRPVTTSADNKDCDSVYFTNIWTLLQLACTFNEKSYLVSGKGVPAQ